MIINLIITLFASISTYYLGSLPRVGKIRASSGLTILFILFVLVGKSTYDLSNKNYESLFLGGTFLGMNDKKKFALNEMIITCILFAFLYEYFYIKLSGPGGVLGFLAFLPSITIYFFNKKKQKTKN